MDLDAVIQSGLNQKEKKMCINAHMWNLEKNGTDESICKAERETWM